MNILSLFEPVTKLIDTVVTSDEERLELQAKIDKIKADVDTEIIKVQGKVVDAEAKIREADFKLREQELKSDNWITRNWRPIVTMLLCSPMLYNFVAVPFFTVFTDYWSLMDPLDLSPQYWEILKAFLGVYAGGRSLEKIVKHIRK